MRMAWVTDEPYKEIFPEPKSFTKTSAAMREAGAAVMFSRFPELDEVINHISARGLAADIFMAMSEVRDAEDPQKKK